MPYISTDTFLDNLKNMLNPTLNKVSVVIKFILIQLGRVLLLFNSVMLLHEKAWTPYGFSIVLLVISLLPRKKFPTFLLWHRVLLFLILFTLQLLTLPESFVQK